MLLSPLVASLDDGCSTEPSARAYSRLRRELLVVRRGLGNKSRAGRYGTTVDTVMECGAWRSTDLQRRFEAVVLPHLDPAYNLARWLTHDPDEAGDIVQEATLRALRFFASFRGDDARPWFLQIVRNTLLSWRERQGGANVVPFSALERQDGPSAVDRGAVGRAKIRRRPWPDCEEQAAVDRLLARLPPSSARSWCCASSRSCATGRSPRWRRSRSAR